MSLLYPLYALAALGVMAPVLFHLFQRKPRGHREFSSLLFLSPTPPQVTSRSRLSDLLLLICRALILLLLALAFARPFLRSAALMDVDVAAGSTVLLVDTSASMQREGVWDGLQTKLTETIRDLKPNEEVALVRFDRTPQAVVSFEASQAYGASGRAGWLQDQAENLAASWHPTDLASALMYAADMLLDRAEESDSQAKKSLKIVLFSDLQDGADLSGLQAYRWPSQVDVDLLVMEPTRPTNASLQWLPPAEDQDSERIRVLVRNETESNNGQFQLAWQRSDSTPSSEGAPPLPTHVPPGQTRVVKLKQPRDATALVLQGDDQPFDNTAYFPIEEPIDQQLWYLGDEAATNDRESLLYYLNLSPLNTRRRRVEVVTIDQKQALAVVQPAEVPLMVVAVPLEGATEDLQRYLQAGGRVLIVLTEQEQWYGEMEQLIEQLAGREQVRIQNIPSNGSYAMLSEVDFKNPLLQPFADPRYSDFTKVRFWSHRELTLNGSEPNWASVATFDDGNPALIEWTIGKGTMWVLTSGWQPAESQLALSTKFVPLLHGFFSSSQEAAGGSPPLRSGRYDLAGRGRCGENRARPRRAATHARGAGNHVRKHGRARDVRSPASRRSILHGSGQLAEDRKSYGPIIAREIGAVGCPFERSGGRGVDGVGETSNAEQGTGKSTEVLALGCDRGLRLDRRGNLVEPTSD